MNQSPSSVDSPGQESCVFVVWRHDDAKSFEGAEILGERKRHARAAARIGCVRHGVLLEFRHVGDARIFDAPQFLGVPFGVGQKRRLAIDLPPIDAVCRARRAQVREAAAIFHAAKQKSGAVGQQCGAWVKDTVHRIGPMLCGQDRICQRAGQTKCRVGSSSSLRISQEQVDSRNREFLGTPIEQKEGCAPGSGLAVRPG